jgi:guanylate kinase
MLKLRIDKIHEEIKLAEKFDVSLLNTDLNEAKLKAEKLIMNFIKD